MIKPPSLQKGSYKISHVRLSICLSVFDVFLSGSTQWIFKNLLHEATLKKSQSQILENCICCLGNCVSKTFGPKVGYLAF